MQSIANDFRGPDKLNRFSEGSKNMPVLGMADHNVHSIAGSKLGASANSLASGIWIDDDAV